MKKVFNLDPQTFKYSEEMLGRPDIDGVMIATGDFQHAKLCAEVVRAGKDCYVEKPFANVLADAKEAVDAVKASKQVVQMGSQHRSQPYQLAVRDIVRSGRIGKIVHIEQEWNVNEECWRFVPNDTGETDRMEEDRNMEWKKWLPDAGDWPSQRPSLRPLSVEFDALYSVSGRRWIAPEYVVLALLLQVFYPVRSERQLVKQID